MATPPKTKKPRTPKSPEEQAILDRARKQIKLLRIVSGLSADDLDELAGFIAKRQEQISPV